MRDASPAPRRPSPPIPSPSRPYALSLSVMRLTTPLPQRTCPMPYIPAPSRSSPSTASTASTASNPPPSPPPDHLLRRAPPWEGEGAPCGAGALTVLPSSFGSIYASETFRSFVSLYNQSDAPVHLVSLNVRVQTSSQRVIQLVDTTPNPRSVLQPHQGMTDIVKIPLPELGVHKLFCAAGYKDPASPVGAIRTLRQIFRFNVLPPLEPSLAVVPLYKGLEAFPFLEARGGLHDVVHYMVDLRIVNAVPVPVYITDAAFVPQPPFRVRALLCDEGETGRMQGSGSDSEDEALAARQASMAVGDARNFLFHVYGPHANADLDSITTTFAATSLSGTLSANPVASPLRRTDRPASQSMKTIAGTAAEFNKPPPQPARRSRSQSASAKRSEPRPLGHLTISWRSALGEVGHLDNVVTALEPFVKQDDVEVSIYAVPEEIHTHRPFVARCAARNNTAKSVRLYLQVRRDLVGEIVPVGVSGVSLGEVQPGCTSRCSITLVPLVRGQHSISGVRVVDIDSTMSYKAEPPSLSVL